MLELITGWSGAPELLDPQLDWEAFRSIISRVHYPEASDLRAAGRASGEMWRFIREMKPGDWVVIPHGAKFYLAEVTGDAEYHQAREATDTAFRRKIRWLNDGGPIPRAQAPAALQSRMKIYGTSARASDLIPQIEEVLEYQARGRNVSIDDELREAMVATVLHKLRTGRVNERSFEEILAAVLRADGAREVRILDRAREDKGADIVATYWLGATSRLVLAVQAKFWSPHPPVDVWPIEQLREGMRAEQADLGWVVTIGTFSEEAETRCDEYEQDGVRIELIDGEQLANILVESGLRSFLKVR